MLPLPSTGRSRLLTRCLWAGLALAAQPALASGYFLLLLRDQPGHPVQVHVKRQGSPDFQGPFILEREAELHFEPRFDYRVSLAKGAGEAPPVGEVGFAVMHPVRGMVARFLYRASADGGALIPANRSEAAGLAAFHAFLSTVAATCTWDRIAEAMAVGEDGAPGLGGAGAGDGTDTRASGSGSVPGLGGALPPSSLAGSGSGSGAGVGARPRDEAAPPLLFEDLEAAWQLMNIVSETKPRAGEAKPFPERQVPR